VHVSHFFYATMGLIHAPSLKWPLSLRGTSGERAGERGSFHRIVALF
jgi:hypothetical protein